MPMNVMDYVWLGVIILAAVVEAIVPSLVSVWFVPGGIAALLVSLVGAPVWFQLLVFLGVSMLALTFTRPLAKRLLDRRRERTNADRVVGATGIVIQDIDNVMSAGRVAVMGGSWSARSLLPDGKIEAGTKVRIERIEGVKLMVLPLTAVNFEEKGESAL